MGHYSDQSYRDMAHHFRDSHDRYDQSQSGRIPPPNPYGLPRPGSVSPPPRMAHVGSIFDTRSLSRPSSGSEYSMQQSISLPSINPGPAGASPYGHYAHSQSPGHGPPGFHPQLGPPPTPQPPGMPAHHISSPGLHAQKRAYRQRRKDPSCDACRERKVKCDATDTTSCSECSSRNVKCQFTKETNRRMSSIKQVQDLEKQLVQARQQLTQLQSMVRPESLSPMEVDAGSSSRPQQPESPDPEYGSRSQRRRPANVPTYPSHVKANLRRYGRGLFYLSRPASSAGPASSSSSVSPELPTRETADRLLDHYHRWVHPGMPVIDWPSFRRDYEEIYSAGLNQRLKVWASLLFAVLACGSLCTTDPLSARHDDATRYLNLSRLLWDEWPEEYTLDHARRACVTARCLLELNLKTASSVSLASAISIAQDLGLHREKDPPRGVQSTARHRVWWCLYALDRLVSLELGRPALIDDRDCDVYLPSYADAQSFQPLPTSEERGIIRTLSVIRPVGSLLRVLRDAVVEESAIAAVDDQLQACSAALPHNARVDSTAYLEPSELSPSLKLQNARLVLHRHNLSAASPVESRKAALQDSVDVAQATAHYLSRAMGSPSVPSPDVPSRSPDAWQSRLAAAATTLLCTHIWRCTLLLLFSNHYNEALTCILASSAIGDARAANVACGRYLGFFMHLMAEKIQRSNSIYATEDDEELLVYVCGDMRSSLEQLAGWPDDLMDGTTPGSTITDEQTDEQSDDWEGWDALEAFARQLTERHHQQQQQRLGASLPRSTQQQPNPDSSSRMTIANII